MFLDFLHEFKYHYKSTTICDALRAAIVVNLLPIALLSKKFSLFYVLLVTKLTTIFGVIDFKCDDDDDNRSDQSLPLCQDHSFKSVI